MARTRTIPSAAAATAGIAILAAAGCRTPEPVVPPEAPPARLEVRSFEGDVFGWSGLGGKGEAAAPGTGPSARIRARLAALDRQPADLLDPVSSRARLIASSGRSQPWMAVPRLLAGARIGEAASLEEAAAGGVRLASLGERSADIPSGITWSVSVGDPLLDDAGPPGSLTSWRHAGILVKHGGEGPDGKPEAIRIAIVKEDRVPPEKEADAEEASKVAATGTELRREAVFLEEFPLGARSLLLVVPFRFDGTPWESVAVFLELSEGPPGAPPPAEKGSPAPWPVAAQAEAAPGSGEGAIDPAVGALSSAFHRRKALLFLARRGGSRFIEDLVLSADEDVLGRIAAKVAADAAGAKGDDEGWLVERGCLEVIGTILNEGKLPEGLRAILAIHAGEAGRDASVLGEILRSAEGKEDLARRIVEENRLALEDPSPAARVRAFDWLRARGAAPAGFDPLDPTEARRAALQRAEEEAAARAAAEGGAR